MTKEEIQKRYNELCGMLGDLNFRLNIHQRNFQTEIEKTFKELNEISLENAKLIEEENKLTQGETNAATTEKA